ncbi:MAG: SDR family oxidoreductase [Phenylobacterium sp.]|uniref:SDR family oxidoreductase n=1 Tax=Phenylobacterium sp. TaxID=1871053 RepID=UPI002736CDB4|nr:SDR family oxidoreductase [Phenylobacterium sp.]MDP3745627.1 SDR family oxidoreductase [Phenylobacterium sp.]
MLDYDCVLISGASGAVGAFVIRELARSSSLPLICLLRSPASLARLTEAVGSRSSLLDRIIPVYCDLTSDTQVAAAREAVGLRRRCLALHCAAEVSWTKPERLAAPINVEGTRRFAQLVVTISRERPSLVFLSTAFSAEDHPPRNAYEATKLLAERLLVDEFATRTYLAILKCSLVVGAADDGWMARFNGLYPLIRILALAEVPCVIAEPRYLLDTTPVDFVWRQMQLASETVGEARPLLRLVAGAGPDALSIEEVVSLTLDRANAARRAHNLPDLPEISVLSERKFRFLMSASKSWNLDHRFEKVEQISEIMNGYVVHGASGRRIVPQGLGEGSPRPADYLPRVIDHWIARNLDRVLRHATPDWLVRDEAGVA